MRAQKLKESVRSASVTGIYIYLCLELQLYIPPVDLFLKY
jgi:hypothetical protein